MRNRVLAGAAALALALTGSAAAETEERVKENIPEIPADISERLRQYSNFRGHGFSDWTDGGIFIGTRFGEVGQVHKLTMPMGARRQITFYDEPVGGASADPDGDGFVFGKDTGGDEFFQGYLSPVF